MKTDESTIFFVFGGLLIAFTLQALLTMFLQAPFVGLILSAIAIPLIVYFVDFI